MINWPENSWKKTILLTDRAVRLSTAKAYVFSDSVLCMGRISEKSREGMDGDNRLFYEFIPMSRIGSNRRGADGVRVEKVSGIHYIAEIQNMMTEIQ